MARHTDYEGDLLVVCYYIVYITVHGFWLFVYLYGGILVFVDPPTYSLLYKILIWVIKIHGWTFVISFILVAFAEIEDI